MGTKTMVIRRLTATEAIAKLDALVRLLTDAVNNGASVGFLRPLAPDRAKAYWEDVFDAVAANTRVSLIATQDDEVIGSVQLDLCGKQNGVHRAEVQKLCVLSHHRRAGIATKLMRAIEAEALQLGKSLLVLDTEAGSGAEYFYDALNWQRVGSIPGFALNTDGVPTANIIYCKTRAELDEG